MHFFALFADARTPPWKLPGDRNTSQPRNDLQPPLLQLRISASLEAPQPNVEKGSLEISLAQLRVVETSGQRSPLACWGHQQGIRGTTQD